MQTSNLDHLQQAAYNYARYQTLAPDDLLGPSARLRTSLKRLAEVCATLEESGVEDENCLAAAERVTGMEIRNSQFAIRNLQEALEARTDDRRIVAELLGVLVEDVELVENRGYL